ncbi:MAG: patatin-like phospholipase family protein [Betaproteobacteria bacterium]|nr:patatin-like phospholipase family protein [Betaproteobacteria bacterium]
MSYHFRNLVFEGGGVKGVGYLGALEVLEEKGILSGITRIGGTSVGAINAILAGLNFSSEESKKLLMEMDLKSFLDDTWGFVRDVTRLTTQYGWYKGDFFRKWIAGLIKEKTGNSEATFADIEALKEKKGFRSLYLVGTNLTTGFSEIFSAEHTPRMCLADAVRISMAIPFFFTAICNVRGDCYVDGGVLDNYPIKLFDREKYMNSKNFTETDYYKKTNRALQKIKRRISRYVYNKETLGFRLDDKEEIDVFRDQAEPPRHEVKDFFDFIERCITTVLAAQEQYHLHSDDWQRTVYIDTLGISTFDFDISTAKKEALLKSGRAGTEAYLKWYDGIEPKANK